MYGGAALVSDLPRNASIRTVTTLDAVVAGRAAIQELLCHLPGLRERIEQIMSSRMGRSVDLKWDIDRPTPSKPEIQGSFPAVEHFPEGRLLRYRSDAI